MCSPAPQFAEASELGRDAKAQCPAAPATRSAPTPVRPSRHRTRRVGTCWVCSGTWAEPRTTPERPPPATPRPDSERRVPAEAACVGGCPATPPSRGTCEAGGPVGPVPLLRRSPKSLSTAGNERKGLREARGNPGSRRRPPPPTSGRSAIGRPAGARRAAGRTLGTGAPASPEALGLGSAGPCGLRQRTGLARLSGLHPGPSGPSWGRGRGGTEDGDRASQLRVRTRGGRTNSAAGVRGAGRRAAAPGAGAPRKAAAPQKPALPPAPLPARPSPSRGPAAAAGGAGEGRAPEYADERVTDSSAFQCSSETRALLPQLLTPDSRLPQSPTAGLARGCAHRLRAATAAAASPRPPPRPVPGRACLGPAARAAGGGWRAPRALPAARRDAGPAPRAHHVLPAGLPVPSARLAGALLVPRVRRVRAGRAAQRGAGALGVRLGFQPVPGLGGLHGAGGHRLRQPAAVLGRRGGGRRLPVLHGNRAAWGRGAPGWGDWRRSVGTGSRGTRGGSRAACGIGNQDGKAEAASGVRIAELSRGSAPLRQPG